MSPSVPRPCGGQWGSLQPLSWAFGPRLLQINDSIIYNSQKCKIVVSKYWTLLSNFCLLHHPKVLHCLKTIAKYRNMHACLCTLHLHACTYRSKSVKIIVSLHWTILSNFHFLYHPQIMCCLKYIIKYRNEHVYLCPLCLHACTSCSRSGKIFVSIH